MAVKRPSPTGGTPPARPSANQSSESKKSSLELTLSIAATVIAVASLILSVWQGYEQRRQSRLSLAPHLKVVFDFASDVREVHLSNGGPGPALIKSFSVIVTDKTGRKIEGKDDGIWANAQQFLAPGVDYRNPWWLDPDDVLSVNEVQPLVSYHYAIPSSTGADLEEFKKHVLIRVCYCSPYEECWFLDSSGNRGDCSR